MSEKLFIFPSGMEPSKPRMSAYKREQLKEKLDFSFLNNKDLSPHKKVIMTVKKFQENGYSSRDAVTATKKLIDERNLSDLNNVIDELITDVTNVLDERMFDEDKPHDGDRSFDEIEIEEIDSLLQSFEEEAA